MLYTESQDFTSDFLLVNSCVCFVLSCLDLGGVVESAGFPSCFLADCCNRRLKQFCCILCCMFFELYLVCVYSCTVLFVSISQVIGCEDCLRDNLDGVGHGVNPLMTTLAIWVQL